MAAKAAGLGADDFVEWSRGGGNFKSEADCRSVWRSISPGGGVTAASLFGMARDVGWRDGGLSVGPIARAPVPQQAPQRPPFDWRAVWDAAKPATPEHRYIARKLGLPDGLRVYRGPLKLAGQALDGSLLVPAFDSSGELLTWQAIPPEPGGHKLNAPGRPMAGAFTVGALVQGGAQVFVVEGLATGWSAHQATRAPAVVTFGAGRMKAAALDIRVRFPGARIVLAGDVGQESKCEAIAAEVGGAWVVPPADLGANGDFNDMHQRDGLAAVAEMLACATLPEPLPSRYKVLTADDLADMPPLRWRVRGVLPETGLAAVYGAPGSGKSFLVLDLLAAIAAGQKWFGLRTVRAPVVLLALEGEGGLAQRLAAYRTKHGHAPADLRFVAGEFALMRPSDIGELAAAIRAAGGAGGVVAIDTLNRAAPGADENDSRDMGALIAGAKALQSELGGLVLLVHHSGKDSAKGLRGHSSLLGALDAAIEVRRDGDVREWRVSKAKDSTDGEAHAFRLEVVELGRDAEGEPITSATIEPVQPDASARRSTLPAGGTNQRIAWDTLGAVLRSAGDARPSGAPEALPHGRPAVALDDAVAAVAARLVGVDDRRRRERAISAIQGLTGKGLLCHVSGWLWCA